MRTRSQVIRDMSEEFIRANGDLGARVAGAITQLISLVLITPFLPFVVKAQRDDDREETARRTRPEFELNTQRRAVVDNDEVW